MDEYEGIVRDHSKYSMAVLETLEWIEAGNQSLQCMAESPADRISIQSNLQTIQVGYLSVLPSDIVSNQEPSVAHAASDWHADIYIKLCPMCLSRY